MKVTEESVQHVLSGIFAASGLVCHFENDVIFVMPSTPTETVDSLKNNVVRGKVVDERKGALPGVTVVVKGTTTGTATDSDGHFTLVIPKDSVTLIFSFVGMETKYIKVPSLKAGEERKELTVMMKEDKVALEDVVVTGIFTRKKRKFYGIGFYLYCIRVEDDGYTKCFAKFKNVRPGFCYP